MKGGSEMSLEDELQEEYDERVRQAEAERRRLFKNRNFGAHYGLSKDKFKQVCESAQPQTRDNHIGLWLLFALWIAVCIAVSVKMYHEQKPVPQETCYLMNGVEVCR
jgi:hypothetical protein